MSPFIFLIVIVVLYITSKPRIRRFVERDDVYLSREWTSFVNALFIALVVCSHGLNLFETNIREFLPEKCTAFSIGLFGQLMVTTFFFYSGYGIMLSLLNRGGYERKLIYPRFSSLSMNFVLAVFAYFVVHCILQGEIRWADFIGGLHDYQFLGNPTWFILMTLLTYVLTYVCFILTRGKIHPYVCCISLTILLSVVIFLVCRSKPSHWGNTLLCFPAGMFYYLVGRSIEQILKATKVPSLIYAILFIILGWYAYHAGIWPIVYTQNIGGIIFAVGVTWLVGSFEWKAPSCILIWLGGSGLFTVYMFHLLPMRVLTHFGFNNGNPYFVWLAVTIATAVLVLVANFGYKKLNAILISK